MQRLLNEINMNILQLSQHYISHTVRYFCRYMWCLVWVKCLTAMSLDANVLGQPTIITASFVGSLTQSSVTPAELND